jgi:hypothetical protein
METTRDQGGSLRREGRPLTLQKRAKHADHNHGCSRLTECFVKVKPQSYWHTEYCNLKLGTAWLTLDDHGGGMPQVTTDLKFTSTAAHRFGAVGTNIQGESLRGCEAIWPYHYH